MMIEDENAQVVNEDTLKLYIRTQIGIPRHYDTNTYFGYNQLMIEEQSAEFLKAYLNGEVTLTPEAEQLLPDYLLVLKQSSYKPIRKLLQKASQKYKEDIIKRHKEEEKIKAFVSTKFNILQNKKAMTKMSSSDMLTIAELLEQEKGYSTKRMKDQLKSFAMLKIDKTFKGEMPADEKFAKLVQTFGTPRQKDYVLRHFSQQVVSEEVIPVEEKKKEKKLGGWFKRQWKNIRRGLVVAGIAVLGLIGGKMVLNNIGETTPDNKAGYPDKTEQTITPPKADKPVVAVEKTQDAANQDFMTALDNLNKAYEDRFDSALEIHLGAEKRDQLYQKIDALAKDGKIQLKDRTTLKEYAYAFTIYAEVAPNSKEAQTIKGFLNGDEVKPEVLHDLVIKAKRDGSGIKGSGTHSNFDVAPEKLQKQHLNNRKKVNNAEKMLEKYKDQKSR